MKDEITEFYREMDASLKVKVKCLSEVKHRGHYDDDMVEVILCRASGQYSTNPQLQHKAIKTVLLLMNEGYFNTR